MKVERGGLVDDSDRRNIGTQQKENRHDLEYLPTGKIRVIRKSSCYRQITQVEDKCAGQYTTESFSVV